jgi:catechol 2,3-dioxygenase-like lactoylglutathione lyase family enzyme
MQLNHIDLQVTDVVRSAAFFARYFGFRQTSNPGSPAIAILAGDGGVVLVLQRRTDDRPWPDGFHVGFLVDDVATVHRGTMTYCRHDGFLVEVGVRRQG